MEKKKVKALIIRQEEIAKDVFDLWLETDMAEGTVPGQFVAIYPRNQATLLPRPISVCEVNQEKTRIRLVYRILGKGTKEFSTYRAGEEISILGSIGNGFPLEEGKGKRTLLIGGGIGIPPMLQLAKELDADKTILLGFRDQELFLDQELSAYGLVYIATENGAVGTKGNVMDIIAEKDLKADIIYACGPLPMLKAIKEYAAEHKIKAYLSLEEKMACGIGACLGCVCKTTKVDHHSHVHNARVCTEGPVFEAEEVEL